MKINVSCLPTANAADKKKAIEDELQAYNAWFSKPRSDGGAGNSPLHPQEVVMIRTYLTARLGGLFPGAEGSGQS